MKIYCFLLAMLFTSVAFAGKNLIPDNEPTPMQSLRWKGFNVGINPGILKNKTRGKVDPNDALGPLPGRSDSWGYDNYGFTVGAQVGYKYQWSFLVLGLETDFNYSSLSRSHNYTGYNTTDGTITDTIKHEMYWYGTLRPIFGFCFKHVFIYGTGGFSYGQIKSTAEYIILADPYRGSLNTTKPGWNVGGGIEFVLIKMLSLNAQYLFVDLRNITYRATDTTGTYPTYNFIVKLNNKFNCIRLALNYMF